MKSGVYWPRKVAGENDMTYLKKLLVHGLLAPIASVQDTNCKMKKDNYN